MGEPMDELQQFFKDSVSDQMRVLERLLDPIERGDKESIEQARRIAHSLKGSGTSYGFPEVSSAAASAERASEDDMRRSFESLVGVLEGISRATPRSLVLIVDDDPLISRLLEARLTTPNRRAATMASIEAARGFIEQHTPDVILLDLFLPDGDGRTLLTDIRHREELVSTPVLVISGASGQPIEDEVQNLGADGFFPKPLDVDNLVAEVSATLSTVSQVAEVGRSALTSSYRTLLDRELPVAVAAIVPESHGPGGRAPDGSDPAVAAPIVDAVAESVGADGTVAEWADGEIAVVSSLDDTELTKRVDRARLRLRTVAHPETDGRLISFSAAVVPDSGRGLNDSYWRAHMFALDANQAGGDRVASTTTDRPRNRVLLAEDDTLTAALIIHRLEREGFDVVHHGDGNSALESAENEDFGLVVLDVQMPGLDGFEVLERLRAMRSMDDTPIVMLTAVGWERDVVRGFELGADDYILKPFSPAELTARLKRFSRS